MKVYYPGARGNDIVDRIDSKITDANVNARVFVHVGTNYIGDKSEGLFKDFQNLIR